MQQLAYGTRITIDARHLALESMEVEARAQALADAWPLGGGLRRHRVEDGGVTLAFLGSQGSLLLHVFPEEARLTVVAFTVGAVSAAAFVARVEELFELGVYDLRRSRYGHFFPQEEALLERVLLGERFLAKARAAATVG
ncbi:hypothetical protein [Oceanithermus profundus]